MQVDDLVLALVADQHEEGAVALRHTILDQRADAVVHLLLHRRRPGQRRKLPSGASRELSLPQRGLGRSLHRSCRPLPVSYLVIAQLCCYTLFSRRW